MRRFVIAVLLAMLASACSNAPLDVTAGEATSGGSLLDETSVDEAQPAELGPNAADEASQVDELPSKPQTDVALPYEWSITISQAGATDPNSAEVLRISWFANPTTGEGTANIAVSDLLYEQALNSRGPEDDIPTRASLVDIESDASVESAFVDGEWFTRGLLPQFDYGSWVDVDAIDPNTWYAEPYVFDASPNFLGEGQQGDELRNRLTDFMEISDEDDFGGFTGVLLGEDGPTSVEGTVLESFSSEFLTQIVVTTSADGLIRTVELRPVDPLGDPNVFNEVHMEFFNFGEEMILPDIADAPPFPARDLLDDAEFVEIVDLGQPLDIDSTAGLVDGEFELIDVIDPDDPASAAIAPVADPDRVVFRFWTFLGFQNDDPTAPPEFSVSLTEGGLLVRVDGTSIFDGSESYTSWQLSSAGIDALLASIEANPAVWGEGRSFEPTGSNDLAYVLQLFDVAVVNANPHMGEASAEGQEALRDLAALMFDPSFLGDGIVSGPDQWVPPVLSFSVRPGASDLSRTSHEWPIDTPLDQLIDDGEQSSLCLFGEDATIAWDALVNEGENSAHINVIDDGAQWTLTYRAQYPGYRLSSDPCRR